MNSGKKQMLYANRPFLSTVIGGFHCYLEKVSLGESMPLTQGWLKFA